MSEIEDLKSFIIEQNLSLKQHMEKRLQEVAESLSKTKHSEDRYINCTEVQRILKVSAPVVYNWIRDGLLTTKESNKPINNRFLLSEIEWLKNQPYRNASAVMIRDLIIKRKREFQ